MEIILTIFVVLWVAGAVAGALTGWTNEDKIGGRW